MKFVISKASAFAGTTPKFHFQITINRIVRRVIWIQMWRFTAAISHIFSPNQSLFPQINFNRSENSSRLKCLQEAIQIEFGIFSNPLKKFDVIGRRPTISQVAKQNVLNNNKYGAITTNSQFAYHKKNASKPENRQQLTKIVFVRHCKTKFIRSFLWIQRDERSVLWIICFEIRHHFHTVVRRNCMTIHLKRRQHINKSIQIESAFDERTI